MRLSSRARKRLRDEEYRKFRDAMILEVGRCEMAVLGPTSHRLRVPLSSLQVHHIIRGTRRDRALTERCAVLVLCSKCHDSLHHELKHWNESLQLAILKAARPGDYCLENYNRLFGGGPNRITQEDVDKWGIQTGG